MKNVWLFFDVGGQFGLGHYNRVIELAKAFSGECAKVTLLGEFSKVQSDEFEEPSLEIVSVGQRLNFLESYASSKKVLPDICVFDVKHICQAELNLVRHHSITVVVMDAITDCFCDIMISTQLSDRPNQVQVFEQTRILCGQEYFIINESYFRNHTIEKDRLLISFGGEDPESYSMKVIDFLQRTRFQSLIDLVIGPFFADKEILRQKVKQSSLNVTLHDAPKNLYDIICRCQFAITACGTTAYELGAAKKIMYLIAVEDHQIQLRNELVAKQLGFSNQIKIELTDEILRDAMRVFNDPNKSNLILSNLSKTFIRPGQQKVVDKILHYER